MDRQSLTHVARRIGQFLLGAVLMATFWSFAVARNEGRISRRTDALVTYAWLLLTVVLFALVPRLEERRLLGKVRRQGFELQPGETLLYSSNLQRGLIYPRAEDYSAKVPFRTLFEEKKPFLGNPLMMVRLTDRRLMVGSLLGYTWRIIPVSSIEGVSQVHRRVDYDGLVIEYRYGDHREIVVIADKPAGGHSVGGELRRIMHLGRPA